LCGDKSVVHNVLKHHSAFLFRFKQSKAAQNPEDKGTKILQSIGNYSPKETTSHTRRIASSNTYT
jgi:hypothetical protein